MFDEDNTFENDIQISDNIIGGVNPMKQQYQKFRDINKKEKIEKAKAESERKRREAEEAEAERKKGEANVEKILREAELEKISRVEKQKVKKQKINLLNAIDINNYGTTLKDYYDILEKLDDFLYKDIDFFNLLKPKIDQLLQYEKDSYNKIIRDYSIFTISKSFSLPTYLKNYNRKFGIKKNNNRFKDILNKFNNFDNEKINEWNNKIDMLDYHVSLTMYYNDAYLFNNKDIVEKFNSVFLSEVFKNNANNIPVTTQQFIKDYIGLNNLTNNFYKDIDLYLTSNGIKDCKNNAQIYLNKILSNIEAREISTLIGDLDYDAQKNKIVHKDINLKFNGKILFIGDVHGDIVPIMNLIRNSTDIGDLNNKVNWKNLYIIFLGDVIDPFNGSNARICNDNGYVILNNIKTRMAISDMHLCIFFLIYLVLKGANVYYILGNHDIHYAFSNKLFLYLLDCKTKKKFRNLKFYTSFTLDIGEKFIGAKKLCLINHTPNYLYNLENFFECYRNGNNNNKIFVKSNVNINRYQDAYIDKSNFNVQDNVYNNISNLTENWTNDYIVKAIGGGAYLNVYGNKIRFDMINAFNGPSSKIIICGHQYHFYNPIFNIKQKVDDHDKYVLKENELSKLDIRNNINILSLDYNTTYYKFNCSRKDNSLHYDSSYNEIIKDIYGKTTYTLNNELVIKYAQQHSKTYNYFQYIKSQYLTHDKGIDTINSNTINDSGFVYGSLVNCAVNGDNVNCLYRYIIYQPLNYSIKIKLSIENEIYINDNIFKLFKDSTNSFLCYKSLDIARDSILCPLYDADANMKWFKLYAYDPIIIGEGDVKFAFTKEKKEIYRIVEDIDIYGNKVKSGNIINNVICENGQLINTEDQFKRNFVKNKTPIKSYNDEVKGLLNDDKRVDFNLLTPVIQGLIDKNIYLDNDNTLSIRDKPAQPAPEQAAAPAAVPQPAPEQAAVPQPAPEQAAVPQPAPEQAAVPVPEPEQAAVPVPEPEQVENHPKKLNIFKPNAKKQAAVPVPEPEHVENNPKKLNIFKPNAKKPAAVPAPEPEQVENHPKKRRNTKPNAKKPKKETKTSFTIQRLGQPKKTVKIGGHEQTYKYSLNQLSSTTLTYILFYKHLTETKERNNTFISFVCTYIKYLLMKEYEQEEKEDKKLFIKKLVKFFNGKFDYYYKLEDSIDKDKKYYKSWYEETQEFKSMFNINANRFINQLDFEHSFIDYIDLYYVILFISKINYFDVKKMFETLKENKTVLDNNNYVNVYKIIFKSIKDTVLSYLGYDFIFLICHFVILLYECSITNKQFEEILEQNDIRATKLIKLIIEKYNKENLFKEIEGSENNYNVIEMCNNILKKNNSFEEKAKGPLSALNELRKKLGFVDNSTETNYEDSLSIENKLTKNLFDISESSNKNGSNVNMERVGGSSSSEELF